VGGLPVLADAVIRFICDGFGSPESQLNACLLSLEASSTKRQHPQNPLAGLDAFYIRIMSRIPRPLLPIIKQVIAFYILSPSYKPYTLEYNGSITCPPAFKAVLDVICFLGIDRETFYSAFRHLHSVADIPPIKWAHQEPIEFFHKSFTDFLQDPNRSKYLAIDIEQARYDITVLALGWHNHALQSNCLLKREFVYPPSSYFDHVFDRLYLCGQQ
jgi:hypothetical protein